MDHSLIDNASEMNTSQRGSRATSPGGRWAELKNTRVVEVSGLSGADASRSSSQHSTSESQFELQPSRYRPRTFPYQRYLPYQHQDRQFDNLSKCIRRLYVAVSAGDFVPGATHWTREIRGWMQLKFDLPKEDRIRLTKLYYELALAPGVESSAAERFSGMFMTLTKRKHYLRAGEDLYLDWRPLYRELKTLVLPVDSSSVLSVSGGHGKRSTRTLLKMCVFAQFYFDPEEIPAILDEVLPYFSLSGADTAFSVIAILNLILPSSPAANTSLWQPQHFLPTMFHLWSLVNRSKAFDLHFIDLLSRLSRDTITCEHVPFDAYGIYTPEQASHIFSAILRLLEIPVIQVSSPYSATIDMSKGLAALLDRDQRKHPFVHHVARFLVMSLSPASASEPDSMLTKLESLVQAIETFFHPSNTGTWTKNLAQLVFYLTDFFVMRWNREHTGEMPTPPGRRLNDDVKRRFVLCLRDVTFMGIFAKSSSAISFSLSSLQSLAYLEPNLILPGALQRIYPSLQGLVEVHRTTSSIRALHELTKIMTKTKGFRCHVTSLLGLALPGIDANDLEKTMHTLNFVQSVFYEVPMTSLKPQQASNGSAHDTLDGNLARDWVTNQIDRLSMEPMDVEIDYASEMSESEEVSVLQSSTADFSNFVSSLLDRVFNLLRNLPDAAKVKSGSPEENIANTLPAAFTPLFSTMSPEIYDMALKKIVEFVSMTTVYQARDAMAYICSTLCKVDPKKGLGELIPILSRNIRIEIDENQAGSTRTTGSEVLPRDKALVWNISLISMSLVHTGSAIADFKDDLLSLGWYMQEKCRGIPSTHASNFLHHILLTLSMTYTVDHSLYENSEQLDHITASHWARVADPRRLNIKWHYADKREVTFAVEMFKDFVQSGLNRLSELIGDNSPVRRDGSGKEWSDEVSRNLVLLRLIISGISPLFDPRGGQITSDAEVDMLDVNSSSKPLDSDDDDMVDDEDADFGATEDEDVRPTFQYPSGLQLAPGDPQYKLLHDLRASIGETLHNVHQFLIEKQQDDVTSFNALYTAYRSWFTDVGIERSAHVLDRVTRLLASDIGPFKTSGLRKEYPRPLLVRRANVYHLQRLRHNASPRHKTELDKILLLDLVQSSISGYTEIRRTAQTAVESTMKVIIGARSVIIPPLLEHFEVAVKTSDFSRIKGAMYTLMFSSLTRSVGRDWRYAPSLMRSYVNVLDVDRPSIQKITTAATLYLMDMTRQTPRMAILDKDLVEQTLRPDDRDRESLQRVIPKRAKAIKQRYDFVRKSRTELSNELAQIVKQSHWKKESRTATLVIGLSLRFDDITSEEMIRLVVSKAIDDHPSLRAIYSSALVGLFTYVDMRALADHSYENLLLEKKKVPALIKKIPDRDDPSWNARFVSSFAKADAEVYIDQDYPGWLVWGSTIPAFDASSSSVLEYDEVEKRVRLQIGSMLDRTWFSKFFGFMKQEPRDQSQDRFRMSNLLTLTNAIGYVCAGDAVATLEDIKTLTTEIFGDGSDKHQHRATAEILGSLMNAVVAMDLSRKEDVWSFAFPIVRNIFDNGITPENATYWTTFLDVVVQNHDPRRIWPLVEWLASFRLDMTTNAAFKESSKVTFLEHCVVDLGWHFQLGHPVLENFLAHLDHPYKGVREVMGQTMACIYRVDYHESHKNVKSLIEHENQSSSIGSRPYQPTEDYAKTVRDVFAALEKWRGERSPGQQTPSPYTLASKTVLAWLENTLYSWECTQLIPLIPDTIMQSVLHMIDIKEDPELQAQAYSVFRHFGVIPYRSGEEEAFVNALIRIGKTSVSWHQRLRIMVNIQAIYFRHLFLMPLHRQQALFDCISAMLEDTQLEVRIGAGTTLSGMIRCSGVALRSSVIEKLIKKFTTLLRKNPLPKRAPAIEKDAPNAEQVKVTIARHAAILGLGALVQAFPYASPPPTWIPTVLATLATKAAGDPGMVGKSAKGIVSDFKNTRQGTWHIDIKAFTPDQLEDLEGVLWKSYFA